MYNCFLRQWLPEPLMSQVISHAAGVHLPLAWIVIKLLTVAFMVIDAHVTETRDSSHCSLPVD
jgi:hypothetical protein